MVVPGVGSIDWQDELLPVQIEHHVLGRDHRWRGLLLAGNAGAGSAFGRELIPEREE